MEKLSLDEIIEILKEKFIIDNELTPRCYLFPNGKILHLDAYTPHSSVTAFLESKGVGHYESGRGGCPILEDEYGCIRINLDSEGFIELSQIKPTNEQYKVLENLMYEYFRYCYRWSIRDDALTIFTPHNAGFKAVYYVIKIYGEPEAIVYLPEDIIKKIKVYYVKGILYEGIDK